MVTLPRELDISGGQLACHYNYKGMLPYNRVHVEIIPRPDRWAYVEATTNIWSADCIVRTFCLRCFAPDEAVIHNNTE